MYLYFLLLTVDILVRLYCWTCNGLSVGTKILQAAAGNANGFIDTYYILERLFMARL